MVYLSTKIKKSAAEAFEPEVIETDDYRFEKARGFLHPLNNENAFELEAYTKEFGEADAKKIRQARGELTVNDNATFAEVLKSAKGAVGKVISEENIKQDDHRICLIDAEATEKGVDMVVFHKIVDGGKKIYDLRFAVIDEFKDDYLSRVEGMRDRFAIK